MKRARFFGRICPKHEGARGERYRANNRCVLCHREVARLAQAKQRQKPGYWEAFHKRARKRAERRAKEAKE
jgi:hypothetical protein